MYGVSSGGNSDDQIHEHEIMAGIKRLNPASGASLDGVNGRITKNIFLQKGMVKPLLRLFNIIYNTGMVPREWSCALVSALKKPGGSELDPNNYRGISLLSCLGKLFMYIINQR